jgi:hypothetical protein
LDLLLDSLFTQLVGDLLLAEPLLSLGVLHDNCWGLLDDLAGGSLLLGGSWASWVLSDGSVGLLVKVGELGGASLLEGILPFAELRFEGSGVVLLKHVVVSLDVLTEDVLLVLLSVEGSLGLLDLFLLAALASDDLSLMDVVSWESLLLVGDVETTVAGTLHGTEHSVSSGGADETDIEESLEWASVAHVALDVEVLSADLLGTLVHISHADLLEGEEATGGEETSAVSSSVVGQTGVDSESSELEGVSRDEGLVTFNGGEVDGADYSSVGSANDESVLLGVVLVLVVDDQSATGEVVGLSLASSAPLGLISLGVCSVLENLHECHCI